MDLAENSKCHQLQRISIICSLLVNYLRILVNQSGYTLIPGGKKYSYFSVHFYEVFNKIIWFHFTCIYKSLQNYRYYFFWKFPNSEERNDSMLIHLIHASRPWSWSLLSFDLIHWIRCSEGFKNGEYATILIAGTLILFKNCITF